MGEKEAPFCGGSGVERNCTIGRGGNEEVVDTESVVKSAEQEVRQKPYIPQLPGSDLLDF
jgi:hypothetical protein